MQVEWRRTKVLELLSKGDSQSEIAKTLQVDLSIISRDVYFLRQQAKSNIVESVKTKHAWTFFKH
jgi:transcriptional regulator